MVQLRRRPVLRLGVQPVSQRPAMRRLSLQHEVNDATQGVHVRPLVDGRFRLQLFGSSVSDRPQERPRARRVRQPGERFRRRFRRHRLRQTKIDHPQDARPVEQQVRRFDVAMNDLLRMGVRRSAGGLQR